MAVKEISKSPTSQPAAASAELGERFGINDQNLATRRAFIRLTEAERALLESMIPWARAQAEKIAKEFYDWQFSFAPTRRFFEAQARKKGVGLDALRKHLESAQAGYIVSAFEGAESNWGAEYFERRLYVGWLHDQINLPFKWYIGSYVEMQSLVRRQLKSVKNAAKAAAVADAVNKVFNYDMQAIGDSFLLNTLESMGLDLRSIEVDPAEDRTERLEVVKDAVATIIEQADALAADHLTDEVLAQKIPGRLGEAFARMHEMFARAAEQVGALADGDVEHDSFDSLRGADLTGRVLASAIRGTLDVRVEFAKAVQTVARGDVSIEFHQRSSGDALSESMNTMIRAIRLLAADVDSLIKAALEGKLSYRADAGRHQGSYGRIIAGINSTLDAVVHPIEDASAVLSKVASKDLTARVTGNYAGDFARLKTDINRMTEDLQNNMRELSQKAETLASASEELTAVSQQMGTSASETSAQAGVVSTASEQVSSNVASVATGCGRDERSIREIAKNANEAARVAKNGGDSRPRQPTSPSASWANQHGDRQRHQGDHLDRAADQSAGAERDHRSGARRRSRQGIRGGGQRSEGTGQTDRQGDRGNQPERSRRSRATPRGRWRPSRDRHDDRPDQRHFEHHASAVEEQTATTNEIARSASEAAKGGSEIARNITSVSEAARHTAQGGER